VVANVRIIKLENGELIEDNFNKYSLGDYVDGVKVVQIF